MKKLLLLIVVISISWADLSPDILWEKGDFITYEGANLSTDRSQLAFVNDSIAVSLHHFGKVDSTFLYWWDFSSDTKGTVTTLSPTRKYTHLLPMRGGMGLFTPFLKDTMVLDSFVLINTSKNRTAYSFASTRKSYSILPVYNNRALYYSHHHARSGYPYDTLSYYHKRADHGSVYSYNKTVNYKSSTRMYVGSDSTLYLTSHGYVRKMDTVFKKLWYKDFTYTINRATVSKDRLLMVFNVRSSYKSYTKFLFLSPQGDTLWAKQTDSVKVLELDTLAGGGFVYATDKGDLVRLDEETGDTKWSMKLPDNRAYVYSIEAMPDSTTAVLYSFMGNKKVCKLGREKPFSITYPPNIDTVKINPYENNICNIKWDYSPFTSDSVLIEYRFKKEDPWNLIAKTVNSGEYDWKMFNFSYSRCYLQIRDALDPAHVTQSEFGIDLPEISILNSEEIDTWLNNTIQTISWSGGSGASNIYYSTDEGESWNLIKADCYSSSCNWAIPLDIDMSKVIVCVQSVNAPFIRDFNRTPDNVKDIAILHPEPSAIVKNDKPLEISWNTIGQTNSAFVSILLSVDNGNTWEVVQKFTENKGSFTSEPLLKSSKECLLKIVDSFDSTYVGISKQFTLTDDTKIVQSKEITTGTTKIQLSQFQLLDMGIEMSSGKVTIFDSKGRMLLVQNFDQTNISLKNQSFARGVYLIRLENDNHIVTKRCIIK